MNRKKYVLSFIVIVCAILTFSLFFTYQKELTASSGSDDVVEEDPVSNSDSIDEDTTTIEEDPVSSSGSIDEDTTTMEEDPASGSGSVDEDTYGDTTTYVIP